MLIIVTSCVNYNAVGTDTPGRGLYSQNIVSTGSCHRPVDTAYNGNKISSGLVS